jgi:hypothetical protein
MTPNEVQGLQSLAKAHGGSLSVNPETGLVEAGFLDAILPTIAGAGLMMIPGMQPIGAAMITGLGATMLNGGDLGKGLMAGLGAYGGAGLAGSLGVGAAAPGTGLTAAAPTINPTAAANAGMATNPTSYAFNSTNAASGVNSGLATNSSGFSLTGAPASAQASQYAINPAAVSQYSVNPAAQMSGITAPVTPMPAALPSAAVVPPAPTSVMDKLSSGSFYGDNAFNIGAAAAPMLLQEPETVEAPVDNEQFQYTYNPGRASQEDLDAQRSANPGGELNYFKPTFGPRQTVRVAQGGLLGLAEGGMPFEYTYDPATQKYIKKPGAAAPMAAPMGAVTPIGLDSSGGYESTMSAPSTYGGPGLMSMALGNFGQAPAPVDSTHQIMSAPAAAQAAQTANINSSPDVGMGGPTGDSIGADAAAAGAAAEASMGIDDGSSGVYARGGVLRFSDGGFSDGQDYRREQNKKIEDVMAGKPPLGFEIMNSFGAHAANPDDPDAKNAFIAEMFGMQQPKMPTTTTTAPQMETAYNPDTQTYYQRPQAAAGAPQMMAPYKPDELMYYEKERGAASGGLMGLAGGGTLDLSGTFNLGGQGQQGALGGARPNNSFTESPMGDLGGILGLFGGQQTDGSGHGGGGLSNYGNDTRGPMARDFDFGNNRMEMDYGAPAAHVLGIPPGSHSYQGPMTEAQKQNSTYAAGGMAKGGFVVPADVVSALGNGSTNAGLRALKSKFGAVKHIKGKGDGLSDSIPTSIDGKQPARVADGEAYIDPKTVAKVGGGDSKKGAKKLYAMMDKIRSQAHGKTTQQRKVDSRKVV